MIIVGKSESHSETKIANSIAMVVTIPTSKPVAYDVGDVDEVGAEVDSVDGSGAPSVPTDPHPKPVQVEIEVGFFVGDIVGTWFCSGDNPVTRKVIVLAESEVTVIVIPVGEMVPNL